MDPVGGNDADVPGPGLVRLQECADERFDILGNRRINPKQDHARLFERNPALNGNLPEVLVQRQHDTAFGFGQVQKGGVVPSGAIGPGPPHIVAADARASMSGFGKFSSASRRI